jgi:predicted restriction endonuclease
MQKHTKNYLKRLNLTEAGEIFCAQCGVLAVDLHHIQFKSQGGSDNPDNIIALCRLHHLAAHQFNTPEHRDLLTKLQADILGDYH